MATSQSSPSGGAASGPVTTQMEFAVQMSCQSCEEAVKKALANEPGVSSVYVNLADEVVLVQSTLPSSKVQSLLQSTGKLVVFRGYGGADQHAAPPTHHGAAVTVMRGEGGVSGLARLVQVSPERCLIEGTVDGLMKAGTYSLTVCEYGDLSEGCTSCGDVYGGAMGELGSVAADEDGRAVFQIISEQLKVYNIIGRSMVVATAGDSCESGVRVMCGIIARSAGLFQNSKKVCTCDGVTIWEEARKKAAL